MNKLKIGHEWTDGERLNVAAMIAASVKRSILDGLKLPPLEMVHRLVLIEFLANQEQAALEANRQQYAEWID